MPAEHLAPVVSRTHVDMRIELAVHRIDGPRQGNDLKIPLKLVGVILFFAYLIHAHGKVIGRAQRRYAGQPDVLLQRDRLYLREYLLTLILLATMLLPNLLYSMRLYLLSKRRAVNHFVLWLAS